MIVERRFSFSDFNASRLKKKKKKKTKKKEKKKNFKFSNHRVAKEKVKFTHVESKQSNNTCVGL
jgi:ribosomal 30S subunit maturation factor RimM